MGGAAGPDTLELIVQPQQGPELPTFRYEMRQIYRVAGADLDPASLTVGVTLNRSERPLTGNAQTYLQLLGLAIPSDAAVFDRDNRLFPRTPRPATRPRSCTTRTSSSRTSSRSPTRPGSRRRRRSDSLYRTPLFLLPRQGPPAKFALRLRYNATGGGDRSTLNLNALQLREGSEQLFVGGRKLVRGVDYTISYDLGQVTFLNPDALFGQGSAQVTARFEERGLFAVAPDHDPRAVHPLLASASAARSTSSACTSGAERLQPPGARVRGVGQPDRRREHRAALQAQRASPAS